MHYQMVKFFTIVPTRGSFVDTYMGIVSLLDTEIYETCLRNRRFVKQNLPSYGILGKLRRPSKGGLLKIDMDCMEL